MTNKLILTLSLSFFLTACNNTKPEEEPSQQPQANAVSQTIYLSDITFSDEVADGEFKTQCSMIPALTESVLNSSKDTLTNILSSNSIMEEQYELNVTYIYVESHKWRFPSVRPGSEATIKATILKNGVVEYSTQKSIDSWVAFGACSRLEKIARAEGRYIAQWVSNTIPAAQ